METETKNAVLCYVKDQWAFFTTQPLQDQWGDDWNDAPYEHNAGYPYTYGNQDTKKPWLIFKVAWDGPFETPCTGRCNSPWSVEQINAGAVAWLRASSYGLVQKTLVIPAGTTLERFCDLIREGGGCVYLPREC